MPRSVNIETFLGAHSFLNRYPNANKLRGLLTQHDLRTPSFRPVLNAKRETFPNPCALLVVDNAASMLLLCYHLLRNSPSSPLLSLTAFETGQIAITSTIVSSRSSRQKCKKTVRETSRESHHSLFRCVCLCPSLGLETENVTISEEGHFYLSLDDRHHTEMSHY